MIEQEYPSIKEYICNKFPTSIGCILSGSQMNANIYNNSTDIDLIIFDTIHSSTKGYNLFWNNIKLDCVIIPINDFHNSIISELQDYKGVVVTMITTGKILFDHSNSIIKEIQLILLSYLKTLNGSENLKYSNYHSNIRKVHKYLQREISTTKKDFLVCEFVTQYFGLQTIKKSYFESTLLRKYNLQEIENTNTYNEIYELFQYTINSKDYELLIKYIELFISTELYKPQINQLKQFSIDISFNGMSYSEFKYSVLPKLNKNNILGKYLTYSHLTEKKYGHLYKNDILLKFNLQNLNSFVSIYKEFKNEIKNQSGLINKYNIIFNTPQIESNEIDLFTESFKISLFKLDIHLTNKESSIKINVTIKLLIELYNHLRLEKQDIYQVCELLKYNWLGNCMPYSTDIDSHYNYVNDKINYFEFNYSNLIVETNISEIISLEVYLNIVSKIKQINQTLINADWYRFIPDDYFKYYIISDIKKVRVFISLLQTIFLLLNNTDDEKESVVLYLIELNK